jgi:hypothetical protein
LDSGFPVTITRGRSETIALAKEVRQLKLSQQHRVQHPESKSSKEFISVLNQKKQQLFLDYPFLKQWD